MRVKKFLRSAAFLALASAAAKILGAVHKIPLMGLLGAEGSGLYQLVFPIYTVVLALAGGGVSQAVSRAAAQEGEGARSSLKAALLLTALTGGAGSAALALLCRAIARAQGNPAAASAYLVLAPSVAASCMASAVCGGWQGRRNKVPTAVGWVVGQAGKLIAGLSLAAAFLPRGTEYAVTGAIAGVTIGEIATAFALLAVSVPTRAKAPPRPLIPLVRGIFRDAAPAALGSLVMPLLQLIDSVTIVNLLTASGRSPETATALYGVATAPVGAIAGLPPVLMSACAAALMPKLFGGEEEKRRAVGGALSAALVAGLLGSALMLVFAEEVIGVIYPGGLTAEQFATAAAAMRFAAPGVTYVCFMSVATTALQAEGRAHVPALVLLVCGAVKAGLTVLLVRTAGAAGSAAATSAAYCAALCADLIAARGSVAGGMRRKDALVFVAAVMAGCAAGALSKLIPAGALAACFVRGGIAALTVLLVLVAADAYSLNGRIAEKIKLFRAGFAKKTKKH